MTFADATAEAHAARERYQWRKLTLPHADEWGQYAAPHDGTPVIVQVKSQTAEYVTLGYYIPGAGGFYFSNRNARGVSEMLPIWGAIVRWMPAPPLWSASDERDQDAN